MHALLVAGALVAYVEDFADGTSRIRYAEDTFERAPHVVDGDPSTVRVAVVLLDFDGSKPQDFTVADAAARMATVRAYYQELSYGIWNIESEVFGPYSIPRPPDCDLGRIGDLARQQGDFDAFDHVAVTLPDNGDTGLDCACGVAWLGRTPAQENPEILHTSLYTCTDPNAFAHELGHAFGLHHASTADCAGEPMRRDIHGACSIDEYGNQFNTMGNGLGHMNAFQKSTMKWLDGCNVVRVTGDGVFELVPMPVESAQIQALQIATGDTRDGNPLFYYVELRDPSLATFNAGGDSPREQGPGLHIDVAPDRVIADGDRRPLLLDLSPGTPGEFADPRLTPGRSFTDPDGRVTITMVDATHVQVTFPGGGAGPNLCLDGTTPPEPQDPPDAGAGGGADAGSPADEDDLGGGCGCDTGGAPSGWLAILLATLGWSKMRRCAGRRSTGRSPSRGTS